MYIQGVPKKSLWCDLEEKCLGNSNIFFDGVFLSVYSHLLKKLELYKLCGEKVMRLLKSWKWLVLSYLEIFQKNLVFFFPVLNLLQGRYLCMKKYYFYFRCYFNQFWSYKRFKISTFAAALIILWALLQFLT